MSKKLTIEFIRAEFEKEDYELLTTEYDNNIQKLEYICPEGHRHSVSWSNWKKNVRCPYRVGNMKPTIEFIRAEFAKEGYILLTKEYKNNHTKLEYICSRGHKHKIWWMAWNSSKKHRCPYCANNGKPTIKFIRKKFAKEGYKLLTRAYENAHQKLEYICPKGHKHSVTWSNWQENSRCPCFSNNMRLTIEFIRSEFVKEGYTLLSKVYKNNYTKLDYVCPNGHKHSVTWAHWNSKEKRRCPFCNNAGVSKWEKTIKKFFDALGVDYISNDRTQLINPNTKRSLELDLWFPQFSKAIECNGVYWHSKVDRQKCDKIKKQLCKEQEIDLLVLTDREWNNNIDKCKNKIQEFLC